MQFSFRRAGDTVGWPRIYVIRFGWCFHEVLARIDVPVLRGHYQRVFSALFGEKTGNALGEGGTSFITKYSNLPTGCLLLNHQHFQLFPRTAPHLSTLFSQTSA